MFKVGDQVKYIDGLSSVLFDENVVYTINKIPKFSPSGNYTPPSLGFEGLLGYFAASRFELVEPAYLTYPTLRSDYV